SVPETLISIACRTLATIVTFVRRCWPSSLPAACHFLRRDRFTPRLFFFAADRFPAAALLSTRKSSRLAPALIAAVSQRGCAPLPAQVLPALSRYLIGTFRPFRDPARFLP